MGLLSGILGGTVGKIIGEIQSVLKSVPESTTRTSKSSSGLRIIVLPGEWGGSSLVDIKKVCESAGEFITTQLIDDGFPPILSRRVLG